MVEGAPEGEGQPGGEGTGEGEGEGGIEGEGALEGEGQPEGEGSAEGEGAPEGETLDPPYAIGVTALTLTDPSRGNREIPVEVYYPAEFAGVDAPAIANPTEPFPVISFGHGFLIGIGFYPYIPDALVPEGYVLVLVDTETGFPDHGAFGRDLAFAADEILALHDAPGSFLEGTLAPKTGVAGHSMGGGATLLSVQHSANIGAVMPIAAADTNPSATEAAASITIPGLIVSGSEDCVAPPNQQQVPMYEALASDVKYYANITEGSHCQFAVNSGICNAGQIICPFRQYVDAGTQRRATTDLMLAWFDATLRGRPAGLAPFDALLQQLTADEIITFETE